MAVSAAEVEKIIRTELLGHWDSHQLQESDRRFSSYVRMDALRVAHILSLLPPDRAFSALEIGVGYGYVVAPLARFFPKARIFAIEAPGREYLGTDAFERMLTASRTSLAVCDMTDGPLPYQDNFFDFVLFSEVIEHLPPEAIHGVLAEFHRTLTPGGQLILTTPNATRLRNRLRFFAGKSIFESPVHTVGGTFGHLREYTREELLDMVRSAEFSHVESIPMAVRFPIMETLPERVVSSLGASLSHLSPGFQDFLCVRATK